MEKEELAPDCQPILRTVEVGGLSKPELLERLNEHAVLLNEYGRRLMEDERFTVSEETYHLHTVELTVGSLGFPDGATMPRIFTRANELGLALCPLELGPFLRLQYLNQPEGQSGKPMKRRQAPSGSITIASKPLDEDDDFPKGFYLRKMDGELWLRGYCADDLHVWNSEDHFLFCEKGQGMK